MPLDSITYSPPLSRLPRDTNGLIHDRLLGRCGVESRPDGTEHVLLPCGGQVQRLSLIHI